MDYRYGSSVLTLVELAFNSFSWALFMCLLPLPCCNMKGFSQKLLTNS